jgi:hypothetical protein
VSGLLSELVPNIQQITIVTVNTLSTNFNINSLN